MIRSVYFLLTFIVTLSIAPLAVHAGALDVYKDWADVKYGNLEDDKKKAELIKLETKLDTLIAKEPKNVNAKIVLATVKSTHASLIGGISALPHVKSAKSLFEDAIKIDAKAMDGQAHAILGALYYGVPGWPIAFGDDDKAEEHIQKALQIAPNSIDANFFMGDYWLEDSEYKKAKQALEKTLTLKPRTSHAAYTAADKGRLEEAKAKLKVAEEKLKGRSKRSTSFND